MGTTDAPEFDSAACTAARGAGPTARPGRRGGTARPAWVAGVLLALGLAGAALAACTGSTTSGSAVGCGGGNPKLTVQGTGRATGTPNLLTLTMSVDVTTAASAQAALTADDQQTAAVVHALTSGGVASKDVQTTGLSVQPHYSTKGVLTGYAVDNDVVADIHDIAHAGTLIDAASAAGGDDARISTVGFSITDPRKLQDSARQNAVHEAVSHASTMAAAAGERLGRICSLTDDTAITGGYQSLRASSAHAGVATSPSAAAPVPLEAGSQEATAQVTLVYALVAPAPRKGHSG